MRMKILSKETGKRDVITLKFKTAGRSPGGRLKPPHIVEFNKKFKLNEWGAILCEIMEAEPHELTLFRMWIEQEKRQRKEAKK